MYQSPPPRTSSLENRSHPDWKWPFTGLPLIGDCLPPLMSEGVIVVKQWRPTYLSDYPAV